jgi:chromosome segregation ATPase
VTSNLSHFKQSSRGGSAEKDSIIDERDSQLSAKNAQYSESHQTLLIKITELSLRDEEITRLQKLLAEKSDLIKSLSDKENSLMLISADLERALQANLSLQADLDAANRNLTGLEAKICDLENALLKTEESLRLTRTELEAANKRVVEKDELVSARDKRILSLEAELTDQLKSIAEKDLTIADRDQQLIALQAELKRRLAEKDSIIDERDSQLSAKNAQYSESHQTLLIKITELSLRDEEITRLQKILLSLNSKCVDLSSQIHSLSLDNFNLSKDLTDLQISLSNLTQKLSSSDQLIELLEKKLLSVETKLSHLRTVNEELSNTLRLQTSQTSQNEELSGLYHKLLSLQESFIRLFEDYHTDAITISKDKLTMSDEIALKKFQMARIHKEIEGRPELFHSLSQKLSKEEDELDKLKQIVRDCEEEIELAQDKVVFLKKNLSPENPQNKENLQELQECENMIIKKQKLILSAFQDLSDKENEMYYLRKQAMNTASAKDEIIRVINDDIDTKEERIVEIGLRLKEMEMALAEKKESLLSLEESIRDHVEQIKRLRGDADSVDISHNPFLSFRKQERLYDSIVPLLEETQANLLVKTDELNLATYSMEKQQQEILNLKRVINEGEESRQKLGIQIGLLNEQVVIVKELQKMIDKLRTDLEEKKGSVENLEQRNHDLAKELEGARNRLFQATGNETSLKSIAGRSQEKILELENEVQKKEAELLEAKSRLQRVEGAIDDRLKLMEMIGEQERVVTRLTVALRREEERAAGLQSEQDRLSLKLMDQERINEALQREKGRLNQELGRQKDDQARKIEQIDHLYDDLVRVTKLLNQKNEDCKNTEEKLQELQNSKELYLTVQDRDRLRDDYKRLVGEFESLQKQLKEGKQEKEALQEEVRDVRKENDLLKLKVMIQEKETRRLEAVSRQHELALEDKLKEVTDHLNHIKLLNQEIEKLTLANDQTRKSLGLELVEKEEIIKSLWSEKDSKAIKPRVEESKEITRLGDIIQQAKDQINSAEKYLNESASNNELTKGFVQNLLSHLKGLLNGRKSKDLPQVIFKKKEKYNDELINYQDFLGGIEDAHQEVIPAKIAFLDQSFDPNNEVRNLRSEIEKKDELIARLEEDIEVLRQTDIFNTELIKEQERSLAFQIEQTLALKDRIKKPLVPYPEAAPIGSLTDRHDTSEDYFIVGRTDKKPNPSIVSASNEEEDKGNDTQNLGFSFDDLKNQEDNDLMEKFLVELQDLKRENANLKNLIRTRNVDLKEMIGRNIVEKPNLRNQELEQEIVRLRSELKQLRRQSRSIGKSTSINQNSPEKDIEPTKEIRPQAISELNSMRPDPKESEPDRDHAENNRLEHVLGEATLLLEECKAEMKEKKPNLNKNLISKLQQLRDSVGYAILLLNGGSGSGRMDGVNESLGASYNSLYSDRLKRAASSKSSEKKPPNKDEKPSRESIQRAMAHDTEGFLKDVREVYSDILIYLQKTSNLIEGYSKLDQTTQKIANYLALKSRNSEAHERILELLRESVIEKMCSDEEKLMANEVMTRKNIMIELNKLTHYVKKDYKEKQHLTNERRLKLSELTKKYSLLETPPSN